MFTVVLHVVKDMRRDGKSSIEKYESQISEKYENVLKEHTDKTHSNIDHFYTNIGITIRASLNLTRLHGTSDSKNEDGTFDQDDLETFEFFSRLYKKHKNNMNVEKMFKTIAKHMIEFKMRLKTNVTHALKDVVDDFATNQVKLNRELDKLLRKGVGFGSTSDESSGESQQLNWKFSNYAYFIGSYLTTIGKSRTFLSFKFKSNIYVFLI